MLLGLRLNIVGESDLGGPANFISNLIAIAEMAIIKGAPPILKLGLVRPSILDLQDVLYTTIGINYFGNVTGASAILLME